VKTRPRDYRGRAPGDAGSGGVKEIASLAPRARADHAASQVRNASNLCSFTTSFAKSGERSASATGSATLHWPLPGQPVIRVECGEDGDMRGFEYQSGCLGDERTT
jgi:hypothetical protein